MRSHWEQIKLADLFELQMGKTPAREKEQYWKNGTRKWVSIADISKFSRYTENTKESITDQAVSETGIRQVPANTIIMSFKLSLGKVAITSEPLYTNEAIMAFVDRKERPLSLSFLFHLFKNKDWSAGTNKAVLGMTLNKATLKEISIPVPPLSEQEDIAEKLDAVSRLITLREQQLKKLDQLASSRFIEMFGDPVTNPMCWSQKTMKEMALRLSDGPFGSNLKSEHYANDGIRVIRLQNIGVNKFVDNDRAFVSLQHYETIKKYTCRGGDIVIGTLGEPNLRACLIPNYIHVAINKADCVHYVPNDIFLNKIFVCFYLNIPATLSLASGMIHGQTRSRISSGQIAKLPIILPPLSLQNEFAAFVEQLDKSKVTIRKSIEKLETTYRALLQEYFG